MRIVDTVVGFAVTFTRGIAVVCQRVFTDGVLFALLLAEENQKTDESSRKLRRLIPQLRICCIRSQHQRGHRMFGHEAAAASSCSSGPRVAALSRGAVGNCWGNSRSNYVVRPALHCDTHSCCINNIFLLSHAL